MIRCTTIGVDCAVNDPVDVRAGGPAYLGFDFIVPVEQANDMMNYIVDTLNGNEVPLINIYTYDEDDLDESQVWTTEKIAMEIEKDADFIRSEASRHYPRL